MNETGYSAFWDGYNIDCMKPILSRKDNNTFVSGWLIGQDEYNNLINQGRQKPNNRNK